MMKALHFSDRGQQVTAFIVDAQGYVIYSYPAQSAIWRGALVKRAEEGEQVEISIGGEEHTLQHVVERVEIIEEKQVYHLISIR